MGAIGFNVTCPTIVTMVVLAIIVSIIFAEFETWRGITYEFLE
jgi:hypothetical protein